MTAGNITVIGRQHNGIVGKLVIVPTRKVKRSLLIDIVEHVIEDIDIIWATTTTIF